MSKQPEILASSNVTRSGSYDGMSEKTQQEIRERAYELFEERGGKHGHDLEDWAQAEAEVMRRGNLHRAA